MGSINIDNTGSGGAITLSSDGTSLLLGGTAVGGGSSPTYYAENASSGFTAPTATGTKSFAIGNNASATTVFATAIGTNASSTNDSTLAIHGGSASGFASIAIGLGSSATQTTSLAIGYGCQSTGSFSTAIGRSNLSSGNGSIAGGQDAVSQGSRSVSFGKSKSTGANSFAVVIQDNGNSYGSLGTDTIAMGYRAKAPGNYSIAMGWVSNATQQSTSLGPNSTAGGSGTRAVAVGYQTYAGGSNTTVIGSNSSTRTILYSDVANSSAIGHAAIAFRSGQISFGNGNIDNEADGQYSITTLRCKTTNNTQTVMTTDNSTPTALNQINLRSRTVMSFKGMVVARESEASGTDCAAWEISGLIRQESGGASTTVLVNSAITVIDNQPNWGLALSADTTLGGLKVQITGASSTTIKWAAPIQCAEVNIP